MSTANRRKPMPATNVIYRRAHGGPARMLFKTIVRTSHRAAYYVYVRPCRVRETSPSVSTQFVPPLIIYRSIALRIFYICFAGRHTANDAHRCARFSIYSILMSVIKKYTEKIEVVELMRLCAWTNFVSKRFNELYSCCNTNFYYVLHTKTLVMFLANFTVFLIKIDLTVYCWITTNIVKLRKEFIWKKSYNILSV